MGGTLQFIGLTGQFPKISNGAILNICLRGEKIWLCATLIGEIIAKGSVQHKKLEKLVGKFAATQTSVFGRFGRAILKPLRRKLHIRPYVSSLSSSESNLLSWRASSIRAARPRQGLLRQKFPEIVIYTDSATSTAILAAVVVDVQQFPKGNSSAAKFTDVADKDWGTIFNDKTLIYGLAMLAVIDRPYLRDEGFYPGQECSLLR